MRDINEINVKLLIFYKINNIYWGLRKFMVRIFGNNFIFERRNKECLS